MHGAPAAVPVFINAGAGSAADGHALRDQFDNAIAVSVIEPAALYDAVARAAAAGSPIIGVAGGDGTLRTAAAALVDTRTALLCIPTGTINTFARRHGIPDIAAAVAALRERRTVAVPVGTFEDSIFLNTLTIGEYARIVRRRERYRRFVRKWPAALIATIATLATLREMIVHLDVEGDVLIRRTPMVWIGIGRGSFPRGHELDHADAAPDLEVVVVRAKTKLTAAATLLRVTRGVLRGRMPLPDPQLEVLHARSLALGGDVPDDPDVWREAAGKRLDATADGEVLRTLGSVRVAVRNRALLVIAGSNADAD